MPHFPIFGGSQAYKRNTGVNILLEYHMIRAGYLHHESWAVGFQRNPILSLNLGEAVQRMLSGESDT